MRIELICGDDRWVYEMDERPEYPPNAIYIEGFGEVSVNIVYDPECSTEKIVGYLPEPAIQHLDKNIWRRCET